MAYKVLFVVSSSEIGGAQRFIKEQIDILYEDGFECFVATNKIGWLIDCNRSKIKGYFVSPSIEKFSLKYLFELFKYISENKIDLVISNSANGGFYGRIASIFTNAKNIYVSHGWSSVYNGGRLSALFNNVELVLSYITNNILCVSQNDFNVAQNVIGINKNKLTLIHNSIFSLDCNKSRTNGMGINFLTVCRLKHPKRVDLLIEAFKGLPLLNLTVVGDGPDKFTILNQIELNQIANVKMLGNVDGFNDFSNYDIFLLISDSEGLPISALEAMSCGLALVLSNVGGCVELVNNNGQLVDNNVLSIKNGIRNALESLNKYKLNSTLLFDSNFNLQNKKNQYLSYYKSFL
jgi:glycosyltransferase involved in cell wall biosynthesis